MGISTPKALSEVLSSEQILSEPADLRAYDCDAYTIEKSTPEAIVLPHNTQEVQKVVRWCIQNQVPYTVRGAGTGLSGGAVAALGGVVISTKRMKNILELDIPNRQLLAQTGIANLAISKAVEEYGLHFAPDPSSQTVSTLGGNIAENSGGPHTLKLGVTTNHILQVTMVNTEGEIETLGSRCPSAPGPDFTSLIVGSEGTLGIVTEAWVKLTPLPTSVITALVSFPTSADATNTVAQIISSGVLPAALEMMDHGIMGALHSAFNLQFPPEAKALLLIECSAHGPDSNQQCQAEMAAVQAICQQNNAIQTEVATNEQERAKLWVARKKGIGAMGRLAPAIVTHDGVIPRSKLPEMLDFVYEVAAEQHLGVANLFHAGDGNLHPCFYFDDRIPGVVERVVAAGEAILHKCISLGGSLSGEHGIGFEKMDLMAMQFSPEDLGLQAKAKAIFNTSELCNPCKVLPNQKGCIEHRKRWRGTAW